MRATHVFLLHYTVSDQCHIPESLKPLNTSVEVKGGSVFNLTGKIVTIMVLPHHVQWAHCAPLVDLRLGEERVRQGGGEQLAHR